MVIVLGIGDLMINALNIVLTFIGVLGINKVMTDYIVNRLCSINDILIYKNVFNVIECIVSLNNCHIPLKKNNFIIV